ncbi:hypothetical protein C8R44DRAFT_980683 [Mycena epipterygia]|nr:hypothetical protein C8R44DRAFT_980683 [Mycena epipterygia]
MFSLLRLLSIAALALGLHANGIHDRTSPLKQLTPLRPHTNHRHPRVIAGLLVSRQVSCDLGFDLCTNNGECCAIGENCCIGGGCCPGDEYCDGPGCCPNGETCSGVSDQCAGGGSLCPGTDGCCRSDETCGRDADGNAACQAGGSPTTENVPTTTKERTTANKGTIPATTTQIKTTAAPIATEDTSTQTTTDDFGETHSIVPSEGGASTGTLGGIKPPPTTTANSIADAGPTTGLSASAARNIVGWPGRVLGTLLLAITFIL